MSGPSNGARDRAEKIVIAFATDPAFKALRDRIAEQIQESFDLGHKSAGGAQCDTVPAMGGLLEIALDQKEIDVLWLRIRDEPSLQSLVEKIELFRRGT